jgi:two-component system, cell cycle sensor histidine kinase and response regulator CckA
MEVNMGPSRPSIITRNSELDDLRDYVARLEVEVSELRRSVANGDPSDLSKTAIEPDYKNVFDNLSVCMFFVDVTPDCRFRYAGFNPAEEAVVGLTSEQVTGKFVEEVFPPELASKLTGNYRSCLEAGAPITYSDELNLPAGRRHFQSNLIPLRDATGHIYRIVGACIDITQLKQTQEEAISSQKLESLGVLAAGIAHDFNNLLGSILAEAELAQNELAAGSTPINAICAIQTVATRAGEIVRELMTYAGQESGKREPTDLSRLVQEMLELLRISISKHAALQVDLPPHLPPVQANPVQLRQVIMNLITNASEALGDEEGMISIAISQVTSQDSVSGHSLRLTISDTGGGMTADTLSKIFDPFYTTKFSGRGLGLAAVQGIIRSHDGSITVRSTPGEGSHFEILLPCSASALEAPEIEPTKPISEASGLGRTILIIEDEEVLRQAVSTMLRRRGFHVLEAGDGAKGTELFCENSATIDVILLDMTLPVMTGSEVLRVISRVRPDVKVILTSAYGPEAVTTEQAPWCYLRKPYRIAELSAMLGSACGTLPLSV